MSKNGKHDEDRMLVHPPTAFTCNADRNKHIDAMHSHQQDKSQYFRCNKCDYMSKSKSRLDLHTKMVHLKLRLFFF